MSGKSWDEVMLKERARGRPADAGPSPDLGDNALLPDPGSDYKASALPAGGGLVRLCCILGKGEFRSGGKPYRAFQYVHLDSDSDFGFDAHGQVMTFRFAGLSPVTVAVHGRNLIRIWDYIQLHRMAWIREADRDFEGAEGTDDHGKPLPLISRIQITTLLPPGR